LKPENNDGSLGSFILPIAPIWNWNLPTSGVSAPVSSTNRTNLELKREKDTRVKITLLTTNRTNLELKPRFRGWWIMDLHTTNRTNLELKQILLRSNENIRSLPIAPIWNWNPDHQTWNHQNHPLPIAPIWNWNDGDNAATSMILYYQSHQSGIETL